VTKYLVQNVTTVIERPFAFDRSGKGIDAKRLAQLLAKPTVVLQSVDASRSILLPAYREGGHADAQHADQPRGDRASSRSQVPHTPRSPARARYQGVSARPVSSSERPAPLGRSCSPLTKCVDYPRPERRPGRPVAASLTRLAPRCAMDLALK